MTKTPIKMDSERNLLIHLITNTQFCKQIIPILDTKYFKTNYAKCIADWVVEYFKAYDSAPETHIQDIYYSHKSILREEEATSVAAFLSSISEEFASKTSINLPYELDKAEKYIKIRSLEYLSEILAVAVSEGEPAKGEVAVAEYTQIARPESKAVSIINDSSSVYEAFTQETEYMFDWPAGLGKILPSPERGDLIAFLGAPKAGKSFALDFAGDLAAQAGNKVLFVSLEMRKAQLLRRAWQRMVSSPRYDRDIVFPYFKPCFAPDSKLPDNEKKWELYHKEEFRKAVDLNDIVEFQNNAQIFYRAGDMRYVTFPAYSATVEDIFATVDNLKYYENYSPDCICIDYADIVKPSSSSKEYRHQIDDIWKKFRAQAQARNILVITASQTNRQGLLNDVTLESIAEDMRKLAHVSLLVALNRGKEDRAKSIIRISSLLQRDEETIADEAVVLQCLGIGRFHLDSKVSRQVELS